MVIGIVAFLPTAVVDQVSIFEGPIFLYQLPQPGFLTV